MAGNFAELKRSRSSLADKIKKQSKEYTSKGSSNDDADDRFWKPTVDAAGNGYAVIRLLPPPQGEDDSMVRYWDHFFQGPGGWYVEKSLTTFGWENPDPVAEVNKMLWDEGENSPGRKQASQQKRNLHHITNIKVVNDPAKPENNGKVFLYDLKKTLLDKMDEMSNPEVSEFEDPKDTKSINVTDLWEGCNLEMKIRQKAGWRNYDDSKFKEPSPIAETDDEIEQIWLSQYSLLEFIDPKNFKTYDVLKARLDKVLGKPVDEAKAKEPEKAQDTPEPSHTSSAEDIPFQMEDNSAPEPEKEESSDDGLAWFEKMAEDD
jgi:hypothetical protein